jgi:hypothetical protein
VCFSLGRHRVLVPFARRHLPSGTASPQFSSEGSPLQGALQDAPLRPAVLSCFPSMRGFLGMWLNRETYLSATIGAWPSRHRTCQSSCLTGSRQRPLNSRALSRMSYFSALSGENGSTGRLEQLRELSVRQTLILYSYSNPAPALPYPRNGARTT